MSYPFSSTTPPKSDAWSDVHVESAARQRSPPARHGLHICICLGAAALASTLTYSFLAASTQHCGVPVAPQMLPPTTPAVLRGRRRRVFRDNLRNDTNYITAWNDAGWTNDVLSMANLLYLGTITNRVPILPPFVASHHMDEDAGSVPFSEVFDLPRLQRELHIPIVEWHEVKESDSAVVDEMGAWSIWDTMTGGVRWSNIPFHLNVDVSYTRVPDLRQGRVGGPRTFWALARLGFDTHYEEALRDTTPRPSSRTSVSLPPDEQLLCFDFLFYVCAWEPSEYEKEYSPAWHAVANHMHWTSRLQSAAYDTLREIFDVSDNSKIPPFISVHVRHGDFLTGCSSPVPTDCFAPLSMWHQYVQDVQAALRATKGIDVHEVLVTSDEEDEEWWGSVRALGWRRVDHAALGTATKFGKWYPVFIDAVIQSAGTGFVGTHSSTMSLLARRRVEQWHGGVSKIIPRINS